MEQEYLKFMEYVIKLIDEIGNVLTDNKMDENLVKKLIVIILNPNYRIQLGVLIILISFIIYIVSVL
jgi:hypothetical protein|tara:strand:- start:130 stop:330 length:201 start_codon:yes stop_codon:yes gene_type:complete